MIKEKLTHNIGLKISSLVIAAILWLTVMNGADPLQTETFSDIPVQIVNDEVITSRGYSYSIESGESIDVKVKGRRSLVDQLSSQDFSAVADFNTLNDLYMVNITVGCTAEDSDELDVTAMTSTMIVKRENQTTQPYSVKINQIGDVRDGFFCMDCKTGATLVQVTGSVSQIEQVKEVAVTVNMDGRMNSFTDRCELVAYDKNGNPIDSKKIAFSQDYAEVNVTIVPTKEVDVVVLAQGDPKEGYYVRKLDWAPQTVVIAGEDTLLKSISELTLTCFVGSAAADTEMQVDLNGYLETQYGAGVVSADGDLTIGMVANIQQFATKEMRVSTSDISLVGASDVLEYQFLGASDKNVFVSGPFEIISELSSADLNAYIDVSGLGVGTHNVDLKFDHDESFRTVVSGALFMRISDRPKGFEDASANYMDSNN